MRKILYFVCLIVVGIIFYFIGWWRGVGYMTMTSAISSTSDFGDGLKIIR